VCVLHADASARLCRAMCAGALKDARGVRIDVVAWLTYGLSRVLELVDARVTFVCRGQGAKRPALGCAKPKGGRVDGCGFGYVVVCVL
jgi:hypothetical protein